MVVGDEIDLGVAAPLGCGVQTGAGTVLNVLAPPPEASLVVFGAGGVGLSAVMAARASGVGTIIAVDPVMSRRRLAAELGASATIDPSADVVAEYPRAHRRRAPRTPSTRPRRARSLTRRSRRWPPLGTLALVGIHVPEFALNSRASSAAARPFAG